MRRNELTELHYITPIENVASMLTHGILSHRRADHVKHRTVAMSEIQDKRAKVRVPLGEPGRTRPLHDYVNLYICARNPMMSKRRSEHAELCVLQVSTDVLDLAGVINTDQNAASNYVRFQPAPAGLVIVDKLRVFAEYWTHPGDQIEEWRHSSIKCAEVLVPDIVNPNIVNPKYIQGAYVSCLQSRNLLQTVAPNLPIVVDAHLFFR